MRPNCLGLGHIDMTDLTNPGVSKLGISVRPMPSPVGDPPSDCQTALLGAQRSLGSLPVWQPACRAFDTLWFVSSRFSFNVQSGSMLRAPQGSWVQQLPGTSELTAQRRSSVTLSGSAVRWIPSSRVRPLLEPQEGSGQNSRSGGVRVIKQILIQIIASVPRCGRRPWLICGASSDANLPVRSGTF